MVPISRVLIINSPYSTQVMCTQSADKAVFILPKPPESCSPQINVHRLLSARPYMNFYCTNVLYIGFIRLHIYKFNRYKKISHLAFNLHFFLFLLWHTFYFSGVCICKCFSTSNLMLPLSHLGFIVL